MAHSSATFGLKVMGEVVEVKSDYGHHDVENNFEIILNQVLNGFIQWTKFSSAASSASDSASNAEETASRNMPW